VKFDTETDHKRVYKFCTKCTFMCYNCTYGSSGKVWYFIWQHLCSRILY